MKNKPKIVFMGTPEFAVPALEAIHSEFGITCVVTLPDKPQGRGLKLAPSCVKIAAEKLGLPLLQPESLKDPHFIESLRKLEPDIIVVIAFRILPREVYTTAGIAAFNIHGSLLPKFRGAAPVNWAIIKGESTSGLTSFILNDKVDTGTILLQKEVDITDGTTAGELYDTLMNLSPSLAIETINLLMSGNYEPKFQNDSQASPAPKIFPEMCRIDWSKPAVEVKNLIHGVSPFPGAWTLWHDKRMKILRCRLSDKRGTKTGELTCNNDSLTVCCGEGSLELCEIQLEGKKAMDVCDFLKGYRGETRSCLE